ncbi:hypothetical protein ACRE_050320 [Hapsidospora chrysogenum ATCC 11550]|uniref:Uncharacterized protein n=1 Tax=Hapsidospora chrysogenum (strain ATCC 11550 / CBS 779.69 / DSM 880 / IAM 14645 / JCM 23072 / IMI 49137) TaxID=857340 RepID=A0A086T4B5_HAPC1|nr:hypothetical protein ACRE_050320 [Hapsidospora chrysogenum ATCC 11550]
MSQPSNAQAAPQPPPKEVKPALEVGHRAPSSNKLPFPNGRLTVVLFLRPCGDPFAEKNFKILAALSEKHPDVKFIAVSQSSEADTERWIPLVGGTWDVEVVDDPERDLFAEWGLGTAGAWHAYSPSVLWSTYRLYATDGIWSRSSGSGSGSVWQRGGAFAVDRFGTVCWTHYSKGADDVPDFEEALESLSGK